MLYLFTHNWWERGWMHTFPESISAMWNTNSLVLDLNSGQGSFPMMMTITPWVLPNQSWVYSLSYSGKNSVPKRGTSAVAVFNENDIILFIIIRIIFLMFWHEKDAGYSFQPICLVVQLHLTSSHLIDKGLTKK